MNIISPSLLDLNVYGFKAINAVNSQLKNLMFAVSNLQYPHRSMFMFQCLQQRSNRLKL